MDELAKKIIKNVLGELSGRGGFDHWWDDITPDIQEEITQTLTDIAQNELENSSL